MRIQLSKVSHSPKIPYLTFLINEPLQLNVRDWHFFVIVYSHSCRRVVKATVMTSPRRGDN